MLNEGHGMHDFINGCKSLADAVVNVNVRKAARLHQLHELALLKELESELRTLSLATATASKKKPGCAGGQSKLTERQLALVLAHAQAKLEHLKSFPPPPTSGPGVLTSQRMMFWHLCNPTTKTKLHSGYAQSLANGVHNKEWSITASFPTAVSGAYGPPPTVTGIDAHHYSSDGGSNHSSHSDTVSNADADADHFPTAANANDEAEDNIPEADANMHTMLGQPTASYAAMLWEGKDDASDDADQYTAFQAAMSWQCNDSSSSSSHMGSPTGFDATTLFLADSISTYSSPPATPISTAFPTASDATDVFLSSSETSSVGSDANYDEDSFRTKSPSTSQVENPTPSHITLLIYSHADFSYVDATWLPGSDDMMDTTHY